MTDHGESAIFEDTKIPPHTSYSMEMCVMMNLHFAELNMATVGIIGVLLSVVVPE